MNTISIGSLGTATPPWRCLCWVRAVPRPLFRRGMCTGTVPPKGLHAVVPVPRPPKETSGIHIESRQNPIALVPRPPDIPDWKPLPEPLYRCLRLHRFHSPILRTSSWDLVNSLGTGMILWRCLCCVRAVPRPPKKKGTRKRRKEVKTYKKETK